MVLSAFSSCADESQLASLFAASFLLFGFPRPRVGTEVEDFSAALVSTAAIVH
jgi:hypothetical protein